MKGSFILLLILTVLKIKCIDDDVTTNTASEREILEKDRLIACAEIATKKLLIDQQAIDEASKVYRWKKEKGLLKISLDMLSSCINKIDAKLTKKLCNNLTLTDFDWNDEFSSLMMIDYSKYNQHIVDDFQLTVDQQLLLYQLEKAKVEMVSKETREEINKPVTVGLQIFRRLPPTIKLVLLLFALSMLVLGLVYMVNKIMRAPEKKKVR